MTSSPLREKLDALHGELAATHSIDGDARAALVTLLGDITRLLGTPSRNPPPEEPIADRLETMAVSFEAEHPALGTAIRQVVDALGKAGI